jgi:rhodanese-related sulfurtransferase
MTTRGYRLHNRRGESFQPTAPSEVSRGICRADEQPEAAQPEDDGCRRARQHEGRLGARGDRAPGVDALRCRSARPLGETRDRARRSAGALGTRAAWDYPRLAARALSSVAGKHHSGGMLHELAKSTSKRLLFYCAFGERSAMAVQAAQDAGLTAACHIEGGIDAWKKASGPLAP